MQAILRYTSLILALGLLVSGAWAAGSVLHQGTWTTKGFAIEGQWKIVEDGGKRFVELDDGFRTKSAPDLKIFLSPKPLDQITGANATQQAVQVAELQSNRGAQRYEIPAGTDLGQFRSLIIHCEKYSKLWGGAAIGR